LIKLKSYKLSKENTAYIAFLLTTQSEKKDSAKENITKNIKKQPKQPGDDLVLFNIQKSDTSAFKNVTAYSWSNNGKALYFVQQTIDTVNTFSALKVFSTETGAVNELFNSQGFLKKPVTDETGEKYAFIFSSDTIKEKVYSLYFGSDLDSPEMIVDEFSKGIPVGWSPSENGSIYFSKDGSKLYLGTSPKPVPEPKDTLLAEEKPVLDVWNWKDIKLQPQQKIEAERERKLTYLAIIYIESRELVQLADLNIKRISTIQKGNADIGLGYDDEPYQRASSWTGKRSRDYYLVDFKSGIKRQMLREKSYAQLSPEGKYVVWWNEADSSYYSKSTDIKNLDEIALTKIIPVSFYNERHDTPNNPRPHGIAGWSDGDRFVYIYDHYDIWKIDPSGERVPVNMTKTFGRRNKTRFRYVKLDKEMEHIPTNETIILNAFDERTMSQGFFKTQLNAVKDPALLLMDKYSFGRTVYKAKDANKIIWTKGNVKTFPDLWCSNLDFEDSDKISAANQHQNDFVWPKVELVQWNSFSGDLLKGLLYKPENMDPNKKYPVILYFYERSSEGLYSYKIPRPSRSTINIPLYTSNGYLVFVPDISYKTGYPGQSAYNAIVSGTHYLINTYNFIDAENIGLQGQSWGGYQIAYLITQTDMFAAAMAGAPVSNMTSAYGGIRWRSGLSRMFQYERDQSRIGGTLWEKPLLFIENSPIFHIPKINTPLLMMHNDKDGAVPWYQGIEMFVAMRRLDKPCWLLTYNGEGHNLPANSWANRIDLSTRMFQFFNHYLKGEQIPEWMDKGIPAKEKGKNFGY